MGAKQSFLCSSAQHPQTRTQKKKFASLSKAAGFQRAESFGRPRKGETPQAAAKNSLTERDEQASVQTRNKQKQLHKNKATVQKAACRKETVDYHSLHHNPKNQRPSILHAALTDNIAVRR